MACLQPGASRWNSASFSGRDTVAATVQPCASIARVTDMRLFHLQDIGPHYATTLARWRDNFFANIDAVRKLGYPEEFVRMWDFYLCYCEAGFTERAIGDVHMLLTKPQSRRAAVL